MLNFNFDIKNLEFLLYIVIFLLQLDGTFTVLNRNLKLSNLKLKLKIHNFEYKQQTLATNINNNKKQQNVD